MISVKNVFQIHNRKVKLITIKNKAGMVLHLLNYGAAIVELLVPDKKGNAENVVLTYENIEDYIENPPYFGATVGRTAGRIAEGLFELDGKTYHLNKNYGFHQGHGGPKGFSFQIWEDTIVEEDKETRIVFSYSSRDMEENYPGNLDVKVSYTLTDENMLRIEYEAHTDQRTVCNLTNHAYFNLSGNYRRKVTQQYLKIRSHQFLELDNRQAPTGKLIPVKNTPMDFSQWKLIGADIDQDDEQLVKANGYDHGWILEEENPQIEMIDRLSGRKMEITTSYPSVVIYSYNFPKGEKLKNDKIGSKYDGICFETQYEPDGIHHENLSSAILDRDSKYYNKTEYKFSVFQEGIKCI